MFNMKALFARALLAVAMLADAIPAALAGPIHRISIDTSSLAGQQGYIDLGFLSLASADAAKAYVSDVAGNITARQALMEGDVSGNFRDGFIMGNSDGANLLSFAASFGGLFSFDVLFDLPTLGLDGTTFAVALYNTDFTSYLGFEGSLVQVELSPGQEAMTTVFSDLANVTVIPEPSDWLLLATGLLLIGFTRRMAQRR